MKHERSTTMDTINARWMTNRSGDSGVSVTIVDADADSADALRALVSACPDVRNVETVASADEAIARLSDDAEVAAYALVTEPPTRRIVFIDLRPDDPEAWHSVTALRSSLPDVAIVMLCIYPEQSCSTALCERVDRCVPKDTSPADLRALLADLMTTPGTPNGSDR
jgi:DNA-binding NarL/FixJ family response regulator